jgi:hypothetical protein
VFATLKKIRYRAQEQPVRPAPQRRPGSRTRIDKARHGFDNRRFSNCEEVIFE